MIAAIVVAASSIAWWSAASASGRSPVIVRIGESGDLTLRLPPGHYVLWCNLEGHYLGGMHSHVDVKAKP